MPQISNDAILSFLTNDLGKQKPKMGVGLQHVTFRLADAYTNDAGQTFEPVSTKDNGEVTARVVLESDLDGADMTIFLPMPSHGNKRSWLFNTWVTAAFTTEELEQHRTSWIGILKQFGSAPNVAERLFGKMINDISAKGHTYEILIKENTFKRANKDGKIDQATGELIMEDVKNIEVDYQNGIKRYDASVKAMENSLWDNTEPKGEATHQMEHPDFTPAPANMVVPQKPSTPTRKRAPRQVAKPVVAPVSAPLMSDSEFIDFDEPIFADNNQAPTPVQDIQKPVEETRPEVNYINDDEDVFDL